MRIDIGNVVPGMILDSHIVKDDVLLVKKGGELTPALINRLKTFGITAVDVVSEKHNDNVITDSENVDFTLNDNLNKCVREALLENNIEKIEDNASKMVEAVMESVDLNGGFSNFKYDLQSYSQEDDSLEHSIRVAAFSIVLAHLYNEQLKKDYNIQDIDDERLVNLDEVAVASLLHDRGRNCYSDDTLKSVEKFVSNSTIRKIFPGVVDVPTDKFDDKYIPVYSLGLIDEETKVSNNVRYMILYSSEMENGNGPLKAIGFNKDNLYSYISGAKIIHICSLYDDYLGHCIHANESFEQVVTVIGHAASHGVINENLSSLFINNVPLYPIGNVVRLSTGEEATVIKNSTGYTDTTRPVVRVNSTGQIINLEEVNDITIISLGGDSMNLDMVVDSQLMEVENRVRK